MRAEWSRRSLARLHIKCACVTHHTEFCLCAPQIALWTNAEHQHCLQMGCVEATFVDMYSHAAFEQVTVPSPEGWEEEWPT